MLTAAELRRRTINGDAKPSSDGNEHCGNYILSKRAAVLLRVPDCQRILQQLMERKLLRAIEPGLLRRRYDFLLHLPPPGADTIENFQLSPASAAYLGYLAKPRSRLRRATFRRQTGYPLPPAEFMHALVKRGVLEARSDVDA